MIYAPKEAVERALELATRVLKKVKSRNCDVLKIELRARYLAHGALVRAFPQAPKTTIARAIGFAESEVHDTHRRYLSTKWNASAAARGHRAHGGRWWSQALEDEVFAALARFEPVALPWAPKERDEAPPKPQIHFVEANAKPPYELAERRFFIGAGRAMRHVVDMGDMPPPGRSALDQLRARK